MTELVQIAHTTDTQLYSDLQPGLLDLYKRKDPNAPATVFIRLFQVEGVTVAGFALDPNGTYFYGGISWESGVEFSLFITFVFLAAEIREVECALPYSAPFGGPPLEQQMALLPVREKVTYTFYVDTGVTRIDPRIVVTPINGLESPAPSGRA